MTTTPLTSELDSRYSWMRLIVSVILSTIGGVGTWSVAVAFPALQQEFGVSRADVSLGYTLTMLGFGAGAILSGRISDRVGIMPAIIGSAVLLGLGYIIAGQSSSLTQFAVIQGALIGVGCASTFAPLMADISHWFERSRGAAVGIFASGNYIAGVIWPPVTQHFIETSGWRLTYFGIGVFCILTMIPLAFYLRRRATFMDHASEPSVAASHVKPLGFSPNALQALLAIAGFGCCVAMSMPQVHMVAYCSDLGYGPARGAQMLSVMLACGVASRLTFGFIADRIGGFRTLILGSALQGFSLLMFLPFNSVVSLYLIAGMFGLFQGGIVPSYAIIIREHFSPREAGQRVSFVITATLMGMAFGGWISGVIFDVTGSYRLAFANGVAFNLLNLSIAVFLLWRANGRSFARAAA